MSLVEEILRTLRREGEDIDFDAVLHLPSDDMRADPGQKKETARGTEGKREMDREREEERERRMDRQRQREGE
jgi:hypothetical protein